MVRSWDADENEDDGNEDDGDEGDGNEDEKNVLRLAELGLSKIQVIA